ncbi:MAG: glucose-6-phosphate isomerase [Synergistales bacterium]|nr:glucose-6-phosphate isomerase [Synergistales bacterium]
MTDPILSLSVGGALEALPQPVTNDEKACREAERWLRRGAQERQSGFGWLHLPYGDAGEIRRTGEWLSGFDSIVQAGIGGSSLGTLTLINALLHPPGGGFPRKEGGRPAFFMADNVDPLENHRIWNALDPHSTALIVVSKSGSTAETMANFLWFFRRLCDALGEEEALKRVVVITDPEEGSLRSFVREIGAANLPLPPDVGGRFSVLSDVGLLAASALDIDVASLLAGARRMDERLRAADSIGENPGWMLAALHHRHALAGRNMAVIFPYGDGLKDFAEWFAQLWGESLGKEGRGSTPVKALGAVDQHSQVQLYTAGPDDKLYTVLAQRRIEEDQAIAPSPYASLQGLAYLSGTSCGEMLHVEAQATAASLRQAGRPVIWIELERLDAETLGALLFLYEYTTAVTGYLMGVNPFDQPGVEQGKHYIYGLLGRDGYRDAARGVRGHMEEMDSRRFEV